MVGVTFKQPHPADCRYCTFWSVHRFGVPGTPRTVRTPRTPKTPRGILKCKHFFGSEEKSATLQAMGKQHRLTVPGEDHDHQHQPEDKPDPSRRKSLSRTPSGKVKRRPSHSSLSDEAVAQDQKIAGLPLSPTGVHKPQDLSQDSGGQQGDVGEPSAAAITPDKPQTPLLTVSLSDASTSNEGQRISDVGGNDGKQNGEGVANVPTTSTAISGVTELQKQVAGTSEIKEGTETSQEVSEIKADAESLKIPEIKASGEKSLEIPEVNGGTGFIPDVPEIKGTTEAQQQVPIVVLESPVIVPTGVQAKAEEPKEEEAKKEEAAPADAAPAAPAEKPEEAAAAAPAQEEKKEAAPVVEAPKEEAAPVKEEQKEEAPAAAPATEQTEVEAAPAETKAEVPAAEPVKEEKKAEKTEAEEKKVEE